jgi:hypothetical protein
MKNLVECLTDEIVRVEKLKDIYASLPNNAGALALALNINPALERAKKAQGNGDVIEMLLCRKELKEIE